MILKIFIVLIMLSGKICSANFFEIHLIGTHANQCELADEAGLEEQVYMEES